MVYAQRGKTTRTRAVLCLLLISFCIGAGYVFSIVVIGPMVGDVFSRIPTCSLH